MSLNSKVNFWYQLKNKIGNNHWYFFKLHIFDNLDFGFFERRTPRSKLFIQLITLSKCICGLFFYFTYEAVRVSDFYMMAHDIYVASCYIYLVFVLSFSYKSSFYRLQLEFLSIDEMNKNTHSFNIETKAIITIAMCDLYNIGTVTLNCYLFSNDCNGSLITKVWSVLTINAVHTVNVICFFVMYSIYCRLKVFVENVNNAGGSVSDSLDIYKAILDASDRVKNSFDCLYAATLAFHMPFLITSVYLYLRRASVSVAAYTEVYRLLSPIQWLCLLFAPAIVAGLIASKADELKLTLQNRLLTERNEPHSGSIQLFIEYMHARPMKFTVFGVVPLDWTLPIVIVNLCITYQIAIVQLTHLY